MVAHPADQAVELVGRADAGGLFSRVNFCVVRADAKSALGHAGTAGLVRDPKLAPGTAPPLGRYARACARGRVPPRLGRALAG